MIEVDVFGALRVTRDDGTDLTPRGLKTRALVALIVTSPDQTRSRIWLQDKLWSTRGPEQASGSLRKALSELRDALAHDADIIVADRSSIGFQRDKVAIRPPQSDLPGDREFLQGLDVRDPEFDQWLSSMRAHFDEHGPDELLSERTTHATTQPNRPWITAGSSTAEATMNGVLVTVAESDPNMAIIELIAADSVVRTALQLLPMEVYRSPPQCPPHRLIRIHLQAFTAGVGRAGLRATIDAPFSHRTHGSLTQTFSAAPAPLPDDRDLLAFTHRLVSSVPPALDAEQTAGKIDRDAGLLAALAVQKIFTMKADELAVADDLLRQAAEAWPRGLFSAWRAQLAAIRVIERQVDDESTIRDEVAELTAHALEASPLNSYVLSAVANARHFFDGNVEAYAQLARMSLAIDPANPLAWWADANARIYGGTYDGAHASAMKAQTIADNSALKGFTDFQRALTAAVTGRLGEAITYCEGAAALAPHFRPPLRYLVALYAHTGEPDAACRAARRLAQLEPSFSIERLIADPDYPVSLMRRVSLIDATKLRAVADRLTRQ